MLGCAGARIQARAQAGVGSPLALGASHLLDDGAHAEDAHADLFVVHDVAGVRPRRDEPAAALDADAVFHHRWLRDERARMLLVEPVAVPARRVLEAERLRA